MSNVEMVGGVIRISLPVGEGKSTPWVTVEGSFSKCVKGEGKEATQETREEGWNETFDDLNRQIAARVMPLLNKLGGK